MGKQGGREGFVKNFENIEKAHKIKPRDTPNNAFLADEEVSILDGKNRKHRRLLASNA